LRDFLAKRRDLGIEPRLAQLLGYGVPGLPVDLERLGVPPGAVQGAHQQQPQALAQRMVHQ
jgi:hypothetical protein